MLAVLRRSLLLATLACVSAELPAQCWPLASGCPGGAPFICNGAPRLGRPWYATWTISNSVLVYAGVLTCGPAMFAPLNATCQAGCTLVGTPMWGNIGWPTASVGGFIPNNVAFLGMPICVQGASLHWTPFGYCFLVHQGAMGMVTF